MKAVIFTRFGLSDWLFSAVTVLAFVLMVRSVFVIGIGYDAAFEMHSYQTIKSLPLGISLSTAYDLAPITSEFYGILTFQLAEILGRLVGIPLSPDQFSSYLIHHLVIATLALVGALATGLGLAVSLGNRTAGLFASALILWTPLWLGMGAMNYKDIPVAAGLAMLTSAMILVGHARETSRKFLIALIMTASLGITLAVGTRAGAIALVGFTLAVTTLVRWIQGFHDGRFLILGRTALLSIISVLVAGLVLVTTNPFARINILTWMVDAVAISRQYVWTGVIRTAGQDLPSDQLPWWYAPSWLLAQLPVLTTLLISVGLLTLIVILFRGRVGGVDRRAMADLSPLLILSWILPMVIVVSGSVLYDGIRHLSFALPGIIATAAILLATSTPQIRPVIRRRVKRARFILAVSIFVLAASAFATIRWFPYSYAFINPIAGAQKDSRAWELDYWGLTSREGIARLRMLGFDPIAVVPAAETGRIFSATDTASATASTISTGNPHGLYVFRRWDAVFRQDWCTRLFTIERDGQILGEGGTCP